MPEWVYDTRAGDPVSDLVAKAFAGEPLIVAHRGGARIHPEHTMEGYRDAADTGFLVEADIRRLATGELVCIHDSTTARTMTGPSATVSQMTADDWTSRQALSPWRGGKQTFPVFWEQVLDEFGGKAVLVAEIKDPQATAQIIDSIIDRGLARWVILQSFDLAIATQAADAGIGAMFLDGATTEVTPAELIDAHIGYFGPSISMSAEDIAQFTEAGIVVLPYTIKLREQWIETQAKGVHGAFFDDPWGAMDKYTRGARDPFSSNQPWYGWEFHQNTDRGYQAIDYSVGPGLFMGGLDTSPAGGGTKAMSQTWAQPVTVSLDQFLMMRFTAIFDGGGSGANTPAANRWLGVFLGRTPNGQCFQDRAVAGQTGYHVLLRRNGILDLYVFDDGKAGALITGLDTDPALAANAQLIRTDMEISVGYTTTSKSNAFIVIRRMDTGEKLQYNQLNDAYFQDMALHLSVNGMNGLYADMSYAAVNPTSFGFLSTTVAIT